VDVAGLEPAAPCLSGRGYVRDTQRYFIETNMLVDVAGIEPATPCLQSREEKTLKCFDGVAYTDNQQNSRSPNVPKLYRDSGVNYSKVRSREKRDLKRPTNPAWGVKLRMAKPLFAGTVARVIESRLPTVS